MRTTIRLGIAALFIGLAGCGGAPTGPTRDATTGPSGGEMFPLSGGKGFVEINSQVNAPPRSARGKGRTAVIVAIFYGADGKTPLSPAPTDVSVRLGVDESGQGIALSPSPGEPNSPGRFASAPGEYSEALRGTLVAKVNGDPVEVAFTTR